MAEITPQSNRNSPPPNSSPKGGRPKKLLVFSDAAIAKMPQTCPADIRKITKAYGTGSASVELAIRLAESIEAVFARDAFARVADRRRRAGAVASDVADCCAESTSPLEVKEIFLRVAEALSMSSKNRRLLNNPIRVRSWLVSIAYGNAWERLRADGYNSSRPTFAELRDELEKALDHVHRNRADDEWTLSHLRAILTGRCLSKYTGHLNPLKNGEVRRVRVPPPKPQKRRHLGP